MTRERNVRNWPPPKNRMGNIGLYLAWTWTATLSPKRASEILPVRGGLVFGSTYKAKLPFCWAQNTATLELTKSVAAKVLSAAHGCVPGGGEILGLRMSKSWFLATVGMAASTRARTAATTAVVFELPDCTKAKRAPSRAAF